MENIHIKRVYREIVGHNLDGTLNYLYVLEDGLKDKVSKAVMKLKRCE